jgi:hypothetical protein
VVSHQEGACGCRQVCERYHDALALRLQRIPSPCSHPGGRSVLLRLAGRDGTAAFNDAHTHVTPEQWMPVRCNIWRLNNAPALGERRHVALVPCLAWDACVLRPPVCWMQRAHSHLLATLSSGVSRVRCQGAKNLPWHVLRYDLSQLRPLSALTSANSAPRP